MTRKLLFAVVLFSMIGLQAQERYPLEEMRKDFHLIQNEEDIERLLSNPIDEKDPHAITLQAYQAASTCMMAEYVFSPISKLKYFNRGKASLERAIARQKSAETVYLRLLIQMNVPRILNYHKDIGGDIEFLELELPNAEIDLDYKHEMIRNLVTLADEEKVKETLLGIPLTGEEIKS